MATSLLLILQFLLFYFVTKTKSRFMVWLLGICILTLINSIPTAFKVSELMNTRLQVNIFIYLFIFTAVINKVIQGDLQEIT